MTQILLGNENLTNHIRNKKLVRVYRDFFGANQHIPASIREEQADGNIYLEFLEGEVLGFYPDTENFSIRTEELLKDNLPKKIKEVTANDFWKKRIPSKILDLAFIHSEFRSNPYGIRLCLENGNTADFKYISESEYEFDALIIC